MTLSRCAKIAFVTVTLLGVVLIIIGTTVNVLFPGIYKKEVSKNLVLDDGTEALKRFKESPVPIYMSFYMFNVTNPDETNKRTEEPILEELGPIVYREEKIKTIQGWNENGTLDYFETTTFFLEPELTKVNINDEIYHINAPDLGLGKSLVGGDGGLPNQLKMLLELGPKIEDITSEMGPLIVKHTMAEILFDGYDVPVFHAMKNLKFNQSSQFAFMIPTVKATIEKMLPPDMKFSALGDKNNTRGPVLTISNGKIRMNDFTEIQRINGKSTLGWYQKNTWCDMINGTDGMQFPPDLKKDKYLFVYAPDVCRSLQFEYQKTVKLRDIEAYRFVISDSVFEDPNANDSLNVCFCRETNRATCTKKGILPLIYCMKEKAVLAMSQPHFLNAAEDYSKEFKGLKPTVEKYESFLDIDPITGTVIRGKKRLQVNIMEEFVEGFPIVSLTKNRRPFPLLWLEEGAEIDKPNADDFHHRVLAPKQAATWGTIAVIAIGAVLILMTIVLYFMKH